MVGPGSIEFLFKTDENPFWSILPSHCIFLIQFLFKLDENALYIASEVLGHIFVDLGLVENRKGGTARESLALYIYLFRRRYVCICMYLSLIDVYLFIFVFIVVVCCRWFHWAHAARPCTACSMATSY